MSRITRAILTLELVVVAGVVAAAALELPASHWDEPALLISLLVLALLSDAFPASIKRLNMSGSSLALVLAMAVLGPAPAALIGVTSSLIVDCALRRTPVHRTVNNAFAYTVFPYVGGALFVALGVGGVPSPDQVSFPFVVFGVFLLMNLANFVLVAGPLARMGGEPFIPLLRSIFLRMLPTEVAAGLLAGVLAYGYQHLGLASVALSGIFGGVFVYLVRMNVRAEQRGEELQARTEELASLQVGLITTLLRTLAMRDNMTARHSAAVARYSRAMADELGLSERRQEMIHTAGLFHDVGKFIFPDAILLADRPLTDADFEIVKRHPFQGAELIGKIDGYAPVADIILAHHERIDGAGYPRRIAGDAIPLEARIIAVADTYDVMTSRDSYRRPVTREVAIAELRRVSGSQLDGDVVEVFIRLLEAHAVGFRHADDADFEAELQFERRVREYAQPTPNLA